MFYQISTYYNSGDTESSGLLNFRVPDIAYYYTPKGSEFSSLLIKGSAVYYTVKHEDLDRIFKGYYSNDKATK